MFRNFGHLLSRRTVSSWQAQVSSTLPFVSNAAFLGNVRPRTQLMFGSRTSMYAIGEDILRASIAIERSLPPMLESSIYSNLYSGTMR